MRNGFDDVCLSADSSRTDKTTPALVSDCIASASHRFSARIITTVLVL
jgi:hypothetical protein